ncbi:hypothetical protein FSARC_7918 [Fusarium sarcochroum]|uniref:Aminoglycoside phosphotransferase domain-containing protein n=1 Tax=Fusarium sarcochroum TaxID=1208366 RepID=A0A8H4TU83_9HYPO|nr:hypothetical protein FSARC_7918 [Fusarium sarcochroum]
MNIVKLSWQTYGDFIPKGELHGNMPGGISVYIRDVVPGTAFCRVRRQFFSLDIGMEQRLYRTVDDFARFFALAWNNRLAIEQPPGLLNGYHDILDRVSHGLSERLQTMLEEVRRGLPLLFRPSYPMSLQHDDLLENNIHVDETTGRITGIVDWDNAIIAPFGVSFCGAEIVFGVQTLKDWHFHPCHLSLRRRFWEAFYKEVGDISEEDKRSIEVARLFGLFRTYGFEENDRATVHGVFSACLGKGALDCSGRPGRYRRNEQEAASCIVNLSDASTTILAHKNRHSAIRASFHYMRCGSESLTPIRNVA